MVERPTTSKGISPSREASSRAFAGLRVATTRRGLAGEAFLATRGQDPPLEGDELLDPAPGQGEHFLEALAGRGGSVHHAVLGRPPALALSPEKRRAVVLPGGCTDHPGGAQLDQHRS